MNKQLNSKHSEETTENKHNAHVFRIDNFLSSIFGVCSIYKVPERDAPFLNTLGTFCRFVKWVSVLNFSERF